VKEDRKMFADSERFRFVKMLDGHQAYPVHYRPLGVKEGGMYSKTVRWADVVINDVSLETTFEHEDIIEYLSSQRDDEDYERGMIIVNSRDYIPEKVVVDEEEGKYDTVYRRLQNMKIAPMTFKQAKKKKPSKDKRSSKSKGNLQKHKVEKEKHMTFNERFGDVTSENELGPIGENVMHYSRWGVGFFSGEWKTFVPPIHWIEPVKRWDLIWSKMDEEEIGYKRDYHYTPPGKCDENGIQGPTIYFYDKNDEDLNYSFDWRRDFIYGEYDFASSGGYTLPHTEWFKENEKTNYRFFSLLYNKPPHPNAFDGDTVALIGSLTPYSELSIHERNFLKCPNEDTYDVYRRAWNSINRKLFNLINSSEEVPTPHI
jgi:hypothetical protein